MCNGTSQRLQQRSVCPPVLVGEYRRVWSPSKGIFTHVSLSGETVACRFVCTSAVHHTTSHHNATELGTLPDGLNLRGRAECKESLSKEDTETMC